MIENNYKISFDNLVSPVIGGLLDSECCGQRVSWLRSLSVEFGKKIPHNNPKSNDKFVGEWRVGTFQSTWRVVKDEVLVCASQDFGDSAADLDVAFSKLKFDRFKAIEIVSKFDIRVHFYNGVHIDFLGAISDDDEIFHIFGPDSLYVGYSIVNGWKVGKSNEREGKKL
jgi:hypothetical protein